jgi:hypothetical protein
MSMPLRLASQTPTPTPTTRPPGMPRPPFHTAKTSSQWPSKRRQSVSTWYSRAPMRPAGTAHRAIEAMSSGLPPSRSQRRWVMRTAAMTPVAMHSPYARSWSGPMWMAFCDGLGMSASRLTARSGTRRPGR